MINIVSAIEAVLFASGEEVPIARLSLILGVDESEIMKYAQELEEGYIRDQKGIRLRRLGEKLQLCSAPEYAPIVTKVLEHRRPPMLSQPALETLAVIAYFQPVTRAYIDQIRGVDSSYTVSVLLERGLIYAAGKLEVPGRPTLLKTTDAFLRVMDISDLSQLPVLPDMKENENIRILQEKINELNSAELPEQIAISEITDDANGE